MRGLCYFMAGRSVPYAMVFTVGLCTFALGVHWGESDLPSRLPGKVITYYTSLSG